MKLRIFFIAFSAEIEGYTKRIVQLEAEQTENNKIVHVKNRNEYLEEEYERVMKIIDEMEGIGQLFHSIFVANCTLQF